MATSPLLTSDALQAAAADMTGLSDFGDAHYQSGLNAFTHSLQEDGPLHEAGQAAMAGLMTLRLATRLRQVALIAARPGLVQQELSQPPVFIVGTPRSGTTLLFNMLALYPDARAPMLWETMDPVPPASLSDPASVAGRIDAMNQMLTTYNEGLPEVRKMHSFHSATQVEECSGLLEPTFRSPSLAYFIWGGPSYYRWLAAESSERIIKAYRDYETMVKLLMHGSSDRFWLSKCPCYAPYVSELAEVFPSAHFIHTHRDPRERIPSMCSLLFHFQAAYVQPNPLAVAEQVMFYNEQATTSIKKADAEATADRSIHLDYRSLTSEPVKTVRQVCDWLGLEFSEVYEHTVTDWVTQRNPYDPSRVGRHHYDAAFFGLDARELDELEP